MLHTIHLHSGRDYITAAAVLYRCSKQLAAVAGNIDRNLQHYTAAQWQGSIKLEHETNKLFPSLT